MELLVLGSAIRFAHFWCLQASSSLLDANDGPEESSS